MIAGAVGEEVAHDLGQGRARQLLRLGRYPDGVERKGTDLGDTFKSTFRVTIPEGVDIWAVVDHLSQHAYRLLSRLPGHVHKFDFSLRDRDSSIITRQSIEELQSVASTHRLVVDRVIGHIQLAAPNELPWHDDTGVTVWGWVKGPHSDERVEIDLECSDKIRLDGLRAQIEREIAHLSDPVPSASPAADTPSLPASSQTNVFHGPVNVGAIGPESSVVIGSQSASRDSTNSAPRIDSWWARTWRDHAAALVVTIVGTVLAAALVAWWGVNDWRIGASGPQVRVAGVTWPNENQFRAWGTVSHLAEGDEVWAFWSDADGAGGVFPETDCPVRASGEWTCEGDAGAVGSRGASYIIAAAVLTRTEGDALRAVPAGGAMPFASIDEVPHVDGDQAIDSIVSRRPE